MENLRKMLMAMAKDIRVILIKISDRLPLLRHMASELGGAEPFLRGALCLEVFRERGLLTEEREGDTAFLVLQRNKRVSLDDAPLVAFLKQSMEKGGGAL